MTATAGMTAILEIGGTPVVMTGIKTVDLQIGVDIYDITDLNNNLWKLKLTGLSDYTLKFDGNWDLSDAQQLSIQAGVITTPGTVVNWKLYPKGTGGGSPKSYSGTAYVKTQGLKIDTKSEEQVSWDLEGSGAITYA